MDKLKLDNYVNIKQGIKEILDEFKDVTDYSKYTKKIIDLLENNSYEFVESAVCLYNYINEGFEKGSIDFNKLEVLLEELYYNLSLKYDIKLYFIGEDKISLLTDKYLKIPVSSLDNISFDEKNTYNVLIVEDDNISYYKEKFDIVCNYYEIVNIINRICYDINNSANSPTYRYYYYYYLKNELLRCKKESIDTIISGISYTVCGLNKDLLNKKSLALYMSSQDIYYSYKMVKQAILFNKNIKRCIVGIGYYSFFYDLSLSKLKIHIEQNYKYILNDTHNYNLKSTWNKYEYEKLLRSKNMILEILFNNNIQEDILQLFYNRYKNFFNNEFNKVDELKFGGKKFCDITIEEKINHTKEWTNLYNKRIKHKETRKENIKIFREFLEFLEKNNMEPVVVVFPHSKYYNENLNPEYKKDLYGIMDKMKKDYEFKFIDLNEYGEFDDTDFLDTDHLNPKGCEKATRYLNELIYKQ